MAKTVGQKILAILWAFFWAIAITAVYFGLVSLFAPSVHAGNCGQFFVQKQVAYVAPVYAAAYVQPQVYYQAGRDLELRAAVREALRAELPQALTQALTSPNGHPIKQQQTGPQQSSVFVSKCARCHTGANPKGEITLDGQTAIFPEQFVRIAAMLGENIDVPPEMKRVVDSLTPAEKGSILSEMIALSRNRPETPRPPQPEQIPPAFTPADRPPPPPPVPNGGLQ